LVGVEPFWLSKDDTVSLLFSLAWLPGYAGLPKYNRKLDDSENNYTHKINETYKSH